MAMDQNQERTWAAFCHLSALAGFVIPLGNILGPLVIWLIKKKESALVDKEAKKSINFQISVTIYLIISLILIVAFIGALLAPAVGIFSLVMIIMASVKASKGEEFKYPLAIPFIK